MELGNYINIPQAHPGYRFSNQVPPISGFFSYTHISRLGIRCLKRIHARIPEIPAPMMTTLSRRASSTDLSSTAEGSLILGCRVFMYYRRRQINKDKRLSRELTAGWEFSTVVPYSTNLQPHQEGSYTCEIVRGKPSLTSNMTTAHKPRL